MKTTIRQLAACIAMTMLCGCASIIEGSTNNITISTSPPTNATCSLTNTRGTSTGIVPGPVMVKKSKSDLDVVCQDPSQNATGQTRMVSDIEPWDFGNILAGGLIGMGVDWGTGAAYKYQENVVVPMTAMQPQSYYAPAPGTTVITPYGTAPSAYATTPNAQPRPIQETVPTVSSTIPAQTYYFNPARAGTAGN